MRLLFRANVTDTVSNHARRNSLLTDAPSRKANRAGFLESDRTKSLDLPQDGGLPTIAKSIESTMKAGASADIRRACLEFLAATSSFYRVPDCNVRVVTARPLRVREQLDERTLQRLQSRNHAHSLVDADGGAQRDHVFGTFLSTLCHEFCHHLDFPNVRICRLMAHTRVLRAGGCALPSCSEYRSEEAGLAASGKRTLANRLA
jgi:hypothetical protein